ncbi:NTP transferase domain-containing protein [Dokdonella sp.]|uniref:NTP transferase domain-containing protein n=1 Tax=Dokdonella sp. TaxID=2291710 RepID=UPI003C5C8E98
MSGKLPDSDSVTTAVLAGGAGSRMDGQDKGLCLLKDRPLIDWVTEAIRSQSSGPILIVANRNIPFYLQFAETVSDAGPGHAGPLAGICAALAACRTPWLYTVPVDCAGPPPALLEELLLVATRQDAAAVVAHDGQRRQPLFALYAVERIASCTEGLARGEGASRWQDSIGILEIETAPPASGWINLNRAEEFAAYEERLDGSHR